MVAVAACLCGYLVSHQRTEYDYGLAQLRRRNLAPVLNANGWAVNADALISVLFGRTLTEQVAFPLINDPLAAKKNGLKPWQAILLTIACAAILFLGGWGVYKYITRPATIEQIEQVVDPNAAAEVAGDLLETPTEEEAK